MTYSGQFLVFSLLAYSPWAPYFSSVARRGYFLYHFLHHIKLAVIALFGTLLEEYLFFIYYLKQSFIPSFLSEVKGRMIKLLTSPF